MRVRVDQSRKDRNVAQVFDVAAVGSADRHDDAAIDRHDGARERAAGDGQNPRGAVTYHPREVFTRRRTLILAGLLVIAGAALAERSWTRHTAAVREAGYQATLGSYEGALQRGVTRKDAERYLGQHGKISVRRCCPVSHGDTWEDWIKIGEEPPPWYCGDHFVYIVLAFRRTDGRSPVAPDAHDTDVLSEITIFHAHEKCL